MLIGGKKIATRNTIKVRNPFNNDVVSTVPVATTKHVDEAINIAEKYRAGFSEWPAYPGERFYSNANHLLPLLKQTG